MIRVCMFAVLTLWTALAAYAQVQMSGSFTASQGCPALQSIRKNTNPGNVTVTPGTAYVLRGKNKAEATHYQVEVPDAVPRERWVAVNCGTVAPSGDQVDAATPVAPPAGGAFHILAVSWQPAFCEGLPNKPECKSQTADRYDAKNFTLHGLWPQPRSNVFCNVSKSDIAASEDRRWFELPVVKLSAAVKTGLDKVMPGTQSALDRHEWIKHGTCYGAGGMEAYYADSVRLMEELNATAGAAFMAAQIGKVVEAKDLRAAFDESLGTGAGDRMRFACKRDGNRDLLVEITIGLKGEPWTGGVLRDLIMAASPTDPGCPRFVVDPVGLQ